MATKMKGLFKGLRYISHIFEEEKEDEIQIGLPTDVKHVAHIGWDGPTVHESPSWMKEFCSASALKSAPLGPPTGDLREEPEVKWVSEDSKRGQRATDSEVPRSSRRHNSADSNSNDSPKKKDSSSKSRHSRRPHSKDKDSSDGPSSSLPDIPRTRRKKSKESVSGGGSSRGKSTKGDNDPNGENGGGSSRGKSRRASKRSDPEIENGSIEQNAGSQSGHTPHREESRE